MLDFFFFKMVEMVCLHVINLMEALQECNSTIFVKVGMPHHECLVNDVACQLWFLDILSSTSPPTQKKKVEKAEITEIKPSRT